MSRKFVPIGLLTLFVMGAVFEVTPTLARRGADDGVEKFDDRGRGRDDGFKNRRHGEFRGVVEAMPGQGYIGNWQISGQLVEVTPQTKVKLKRGPIHHGTRVKVHGSVQNGRYIAREIEASRGR